MNKMTDLLEKIAQNISAPENRTKLTNFLGVVKDVVSSDAKVTILDTGNRFLLSQVDGVVQVTVSKDFLTNMGEFELGVEGSEAFKSNVHFNMSEPVVSLKNDKTCVEFTRNGELYSTTVSNAFLECLDDIRMVNMLKRPGLPLPGFNIIKKYLEGRGFHVSVAGEEEHVDDVSGTVVINSAPTTSPALGEKIVIKEVPVYVDRIVIKEVPVEVQKVVIKEVPVYIEKSTHTPESAEPQRTRGPIEEPVSESEANESVDELEANESVDELEANESVDEDSPVISSEDNSPVETTESEEEDSERVSSIEESAPRKLKGRWLNPQKTILKSGEFVYRVDKKINGQSELYALGRWDKKKQKRIPLKKGDAKIVKSLGNKIASRH